MAVVWFLAFALAPASRSNPFAFQANSFPAGRTFASAHPPLSRVLRRGIAGRRRGMRLNQRRSITRAG